MINNLYYSQLHGWQWRRKCKKCKKIFSTSKIFNMICLECKYKARNYKNKAKSKYLVIKKGNYILNTPKV